MRLWHYLLIPKLDNKRLVKQHSECCSFRRTLYKKGNYPGCKKDTDIGEIHWYHYEIMKEMRNRGFKYDQKWHHPCYRGVDMDEFDTVSMAVTVKCHDDEYLSSCLETLRSKGVTI